MMHSEKLSQAIETAKTNYATVGPACQMWRKANAVINGHYVQVNIFDAGDPVIWLDRSSEPLTVTEVLDRLA